MNRRKTYLSSTIVLALFSLIAVFSLSYGAECKAFGVFVLLIVIFGVAAFLMLADEVSADYNAAWEADVRNFHTQQIRNLQDNFERELRLREARELQRDSSRSGLDTELINGLCHQCGGHGFSVLDKNHELGEDRFAIIARNQSFDSSANK